nr:T9SS type A sorting domain-containing protein [Chitinophagaceae bacterium]
KSKMTQALMVQITDAMGRSMWKQTYSLQYGENYYTVQTDQWAPGIYLLSYKATSGEKGTKKLLKQ